VKVLLLLLPLAVAVPLLAYGGFLLYVTAERAAENARREQSAAHVALQAALVAELQHKQQALSLLSESPALDEAGLDASRAASLAEHVVGAAIGIRGLAVLDRSGAVLVEYPAGVESPRVVKLAPHHVQVFETGEAAVSDLHESPVDGRSSVSIDVPVKRGGRVLWVITALLDPVHLTRTVSAQVGGRDAMSTVLDSQRRIVARTRELQRWYGELPSRETLEALEKGDHGWRRFRTRDGNEFLWTWSTIPTGWTVWLGSPARELDDALRRSMLRLAAAGIAVLLVAMAGTALLARRIAASANRMAENAHRLTEGERPPYRPSGIRQLDALYQALEDANDKVSAALADRDRALDAERAARAIADDHNRSKDLFLGMLSHELRNPLAPIRNATYILGRHAQLGSEQARRAQEVIERQTEHLTRLVDDLLDVTRIARGKIELRRGRVDLRDVVRRTADDFRSTLEDRGVRFRTVVPGAGVWADADATRIAQVVGNLLHNAAKFARRGDEVTLSLEPGDRATIRVRDTGAGIDPALLPHVFDPFVQGERTLARTAGGLGLGLALVKAIVELHGGTVRAESAGSGKGAEFVVTLPTIAEAAVAATVDGGIQRANGARSVLVVDDNRDSAESLAEVVELLGHVVEVAFDGPSAVEKAHATSPNVVLCDIGLPGMTGYDVARALRASGIGMQLFAVSGYAQPEDVKKAIEAGFDGHLAKPLKIEDVERLLA
jgi:signal transduction histidine kinase